MTSSRLINSQCSWCIKSDVIFQYYLRYLLLITKQTTVLMLTFMIHDHRFLYVVLVLGGFPGSRRAGISLSWHLRFVCWSSELFKAKFNMGEVSVTTMFYPGSMGKKMMIFTLQMSQKYMSVIWLDPVEKVYLPLSLGWYVHYPRICQEYHSCWYQYLSFNTSWEGKNHLFKEQKNLNFTDLQDFLKILDEFGMKPKGLVVPVPSNMRCTNPVPSSSERLQ